MQDSLERLIIRRPELQCIYGHSLRIDLLDDSPKLPSRLFLQGRGPRGGEAFGDYVGSVPLKQWCLETLTFLERLSGIERPTLLIETRFRLDGVVGEDTRDIIIVLQALIAELRQLAIGPRGFRNWRFACHKEAGPGIYLEHEA